MSINIFSLSLWNIAITSFLKRSSLGPFVFSITENPSTLYKPIFSLSMMFDNRYGNHGDNKLHIYFEENISAAAFFCCFRIDIFVYIYLYIYIYYIYIYIYIYFLNIFYIYSIYTLHIFFIYYI